MPSPAFTLKRHLPDDLPPVIVGAGPAGIRAAATLLAHDLMPVIVDEAPRAGGQIYRRQPEGFTRDAKALYGTEARRAQHVHATFDRIRPRLDYRPQTLVWNAQPDYLDLLHATTREATALPWRDVIIASGATDRVLPLSGWTLPGVYTLGGAQVALKYQGCAIGDKVIFAGTGPLLYLVACQYAKAGAKVLAVLDTAPASKRYKAAPAMSSQPAVAAKGLALVAWLKLHGIPMHHGVQLKRAEGQDALVQLAWQDQAGREHYTACTGLGLGYGLRPETQLADLLDCAFEFSPLHRCHVPRLDDMRRASTPGVYLAGDGAGIMGADAAEFSGELAALALLQDRQIKVDLNRVSRLGAQLQKIERFRQALEIAFPFPEGWAAQAPDELEICRCENVTVGTLRRAAADYDVRELNRLKALCRVAMGRCQGRMCGTAAAEILAQAQALPISQVGRLRGQSPVKPLPLDLTAREATHG